MRYKDLGQVTFKPVRNKYTTVSPYLYVSSANVATTGIIHIAKYDGTWFNADGTIIIADGWIRIH
jgi:hypothetical protein